MAGLTSTPQAAFLLATALVKVVSPEGASVITRALLDTGSDSCFVSERVAQTLDLARTKVQTNISGIGGVRAQPAKSKSRLKIISLVNSGYEVNVEAYVMSKLTGLLPRQLVAEKDLIQRTGLQLADPQFWRPEHAGLILSAEIFFAALLDRRRSIPGTGLTAINTAFGWVLAGPVEPLASDVNRDTIQVHHCETIQPPPVESSLR